MFLNDSHFLIFLWLTPMFVILFLYGHYIRWRSLSKIFSRKAFMQLAPSFSFYKKSFHFGLRIVILFLIIFALSRPFLKSSNVEEKSEGLEIILAVDVSQSMLTRDVSPDRLSLLKVELGRFLAQSNRKDRVGLIVFAGSSFLMAPLTLDLNLIQGYLSSISTDMVASQGTNFKSVFDQAMKSFRDGGIHTAEKTLIIASDGEGHEPGALQSARRLKEQGVRIFTLGFGTKEGGKIPLELSFLQDQKGREVVSQFKEQTLKEFAKIGEGAFYHVFAKSGFVEKLHDDLNSLDQYVFDSHRQAGQVEIFQYFLLLSLLLIAVQWFFGKSGSL